jgi:hypothetical protein
MTYFIIRSPLGFPLTEWDHVGPMWGPGVPLKFESLKDVLKAIEILGNGRVLPNVFKIIKVTEEET